MKSGKNWLVASTWTKMQGLGPFVMVFFGYTAEFFVAYGLSVS